LEKFWAFMKYYKNATQLEVGDKLQGYLNQFKTIEDFRVEEELELNEMLPTKQQMSKRRPLSFSENETTAQNAADGSAVVAAAATPTA
jgi:la-related protein 1